MAKRARKTKTEKILAGLPPITVIAIAADSATLAEFLQRALTVAAGDVERTVIKERARRTRAARTKKPAPEPKPPAPLRQRVAIKVPTEMATPIKKDTQ